jgi:hypothetical protein
MISHQLSTRAKGGKRLESHIDVNSFMHSSCMHTPSCPCPHSPHCHGRSVPYLSEELVT